MTKKKELYRLVYYGGVSHEIRAEVWPYLLRHYEFGSKPEDRDALDEEFRQQYEKVGQADSGQKNLQEQDFRSCEFHQKEFRP